MFSSGPNYNKLKTNLRLSINRLKLLQKKKTELTQKARKEIADYIAENKEDRARIRVEHIIREDYIVEAYELLEMYCDLLLARFGLIQQMKNLDEGIEEAVNSVIWAGIRIQSDVQEFKVISEQFAAKYGKPFAEACRENQLGKVSPKLMQKLSVAAPPKILVEKYMMEIAKSHGVPFQPDMSIVREDEVATAEAMLIDFQNQGQQGYGWVYPPAPTNPPGPGGPPPPPDNGGGVAGGQYPGVPPASANQPFNYPNLKQQSPMDEKPPLGGTIGGGPPGAGATAPPPSYSVFPDGFPELPEPPTGGPFNHGAGGGGGGGSGVTTPGNAPGPYNLPGYNNVVTGGGGGGGGYPAVQPGGGEGGTPGGAAGEPDTPDLDFDDLSRRFQNLKKKQ